ncbi:MAG: NYN domain-containing protein, partial [Chloroflexota bacterium]|nr:NYN domain-containing protein [Chloroflexota bacterium]
ESVRKQEEATLPEAETQSTEAQLHASGETLALPAEQISAEEQLQPRSTRRYRFDRRPNTAFPTSPAKVTLPQRSEEHKGATDLSSVSTPSENSEIEQKNHEQETEQPAASQSTPVAEEASKAESKETPTSATANVEADRRRRHRIEKQRNKAQSTPATPLSSVIVTEAAPPVNTAIPDIVIEEPGLKPQQVNEVSPEDMPPLEYAELQKATSRRRRRRNGSAASSTPVTPKKGVVEVEKPVAPTSPLPLSSRTAANPSTPVNPNQHTITSGYTVSQMNQSVENGTTPFMGPEPSPARGSIAAQNVRSVRTDVQRIPAYPVRTTEATSASVHQLASIVSQAIQTQTDRMIAELRRANQSPTNVSVSLPPFPSNERVGVFVDVANLLYSARNLRMTVDFGKLLDFLRGNRRLVRAQAYCPTSPQPGDEQMFLQSVKGLGYRITTKNYKTFSSGAKKADLDLDLCMDVVRLVDGKAVDCVVLVSGDSDFMPMLDYCSDHGVRVEVAAFDESMSATLRQGCDLFINLSMLDEIRV